MNNNTLVLWKLLNFYCSLSKKYNLMAPHGNKSLIFKKHIKESLYYLEEIECFFKCSDIKVLDMGTGSGFPGIPLAIFRKDINFTLIDRKIKQIDLLKKLCKYIDINNVHLECNEIEIKSKVSSSLYDVVVVRAFSRIDNILKYSYPLLKKNGFVIAGKGKNKEKIENKYKGFDLIKNKHTLFGNILVFNKI